MTIRLLDDIVVNKIAAGEVVDRPESVVRELVDNAVDAGATDISIWIERGGKSKIRVLDNGTGMSRDDALMSFQRHATSKIQQASDLLRISTRGFRGEALSSISSVSRVRLRTRRDVDATGTDVELAAGVLRGVTPVASPIGTDIEVSALFYNLPARKKFLRSDKVEGDRVRRWLVSALLPFLDVRAHLYVDGREVLELRPSATIAERSSKLFRGTYIDVAHELEGYAAHGAIGHPSLARSSTQNFLIFVNHRLVRDGGMLRRIKEGFQSTLKEREYPVGYLLLSLPPEDVDINVHPQKSEVRFQHPAKVADLVTSAVRNGLNSFREPVIVARHKEEARSPLAPTFSMKNTEMHFQRSAIPPAPVIVGPISGQQSPSKTGAADRSTPPEGEKFLFSELRYLGQLFSCYLLCELHDHFVVVDMHAAHERYNYNVLRNGLARRDLPSQELLLSVSVDLHDGEAEAVAEASPLLQRYGFDVDLLGSSAAVVRSVPSILVGADVEAVLREVVSFAKDDRDSSAPLQMRLDAIAARIACHASIRSGKKMEREEVYALLSALDSSEFGSACPHGRPIVVSFRLPEVEAWFGRDR